MSGQLTQRQKMLEIAGSSRHTMCVCPMHLLGNSHLIILSRRRPQYVQTTTRPSVVFFSLSSHPPFSGSERAKFTVRLNISVTLLFAYVGFLVILGGAGIGSAVGLLAHHGRSLFGDPPPPARIPGLQSH